jgi:hypothetical protein
MIMASSHECNAQGAQVHVTQHCLLDLQILISCNEFCHYEENKAVITAQLFYDTMPVDKVIQLLVISK